MADTNTVMENVFLPGSHTQKQYAIQQTHTARTYVSINTNKGSNQLPDSTVGDPIQQTWHMPMIRAFLKQTMQQPTYNLQKQITTSTSKLSKLLVQFMDSRELNHDKIYPCKTSKSQSELSANNGGKNRFWLINMLLKWQRENVLQMPCRFST
jgi:hypothetical protein